MISKKLDTIFWKIPILRPVWKAHAQRVESDTLHNCRDTHANDPGAPRGQGCCRTPWRPHEPPPQNTISTRPKNDSASEWRPSAARRRPDGRDSPHPQVRLAEALTTEMSHGIIWNTERKGNKTEQGRGKTTINSDFSHTFLSEFTRLKPFIPPYVYTVSFTKQLFFMFYMNNSNLLIKITELSIEKVSNWIQTIQMLKLSWVEIYRSISVHTFWQRSRVDVENWSGQGLTHDSC